MATSRITYFTAERELVLDLFSPFCSNQLAEEGVKNEEKYRRNVIKKSKVEGKEHVNWKGKTVPAKNPGSNVCSCKSNCLQSFSEGDMIEIFSKLHNMTTKVEQDIFIQSLMEVSPVERERSRPGSSSEKPKAFSVSYSISTQWQTHQD
ncbi:uncharacterized protein LOC124355798 [Homalodisca vitripennis]|uniref:uncharacterized protein LOC124355798 n=1 Tax=Homalodisca vitripennis TaxID=197043 RepID=UPI001EE9B8B3|nr:uncharacterized protein LOC124355798 [Homalodisca vitripennis]